MKELKKYYAFPEVAHEWQKHDGQSSFYLASEADAAFAEMRREHAEEIERLKAEQAEKDAKVKELCDASIEGSMTLIACCAEIDKLRKQAERYEKLRSFELAEYYYPSAEAFDFYVDQLPASGEKP